MKEVRSKLEALGHDVISRWLDTEWDNNGIGSSVAPLEYRKKYAVLDMEDVEKVDCLIAFTEDPVIAVPGKSRGGRHVEFGAAYALGKVLLVVGHRENIFHHLPNVKFFENIYDLLCYLG